MSAIDASPFNAASAYVAINRFRLNEERPQLLRTHDGGRTWTEIDRGIEAAPTNVVRADPVRRGLLFAGTERGVWASWDDGASWWSLRLNLPATSVRDLVVHRDDLVIATHGRGFWILDDIVPLRAIEALNGPRAVLLQPRPAYRVLENTNTDTPLPPDEPYFTNAPDGAYLDYALPQDAKRVVLTIADARGTVLRSIASDDPVPAFDLETLDVPSWWFAPAARLPANAGAHRFVWNLRLAAPDAFSHGPTIAAVPHRTPLGPRGIRVPPGRYRLTLDVDGARSERNVEVLADPRKRVAPADFAAQFAFEREVATAAETAYRRGLRSVNAGLLRLLATVDAADARPSSSQRAEFARLRTSRERGQAPPDETP
ncbi:MAG: hypothetical protein JOZ24_02495 [Candidatus Eremiobacteraeota bacterium]|nr:hypothetical protein [Candidatus Eremiobacteraeota bacterium]